VSHPLGRGNSQWRLLGPALLAASAMLVACGSSPASSATTVPTTLTIALPTQTNLVWWPPIASATVCSSLVGGGANGPDMYLPLLWIGRTDELNYAKSIASGITVSGHDTVYTIHLKTGWSWSDGRPVTAQDVVYDWDLIQAASAPTSPWPYCFAGGGGVPQDFRSVTAPNPETVVVTTTKSVNPVWFEHNGLSQLVPVPAFAWDRYSNMTQELSWIKAISNDPLNPIYQIVDGPYVIKKAVPNEYYEYVANPRYSGPGKPTIKTLLFQYETSSTAVYAAMRQHRLDVGGLPSLASVQAEQRQLHGYRLLKQPLFGFFFAIPNFRPNAQGVGNLFDHLYIRQALQMGVNQQGIIAAVYYGFAVPCVSPVPEYPPNAYFDPAVHGYPYDPAAGMRLLERHGWHLVNGVMTKGSQRLAFTMLQITGASSLLLEDQILQADWRKEGIGVTLRTVGNSTFDTIVGTVAESSQWAMASGGGWIYSPDYYPTGGELFLPNAGSNRGGYDNRTMNRLIAATYEGGTPAQVKARFDAYQVFAAENLPVIYLPTPENLTDVADNVYGMGTNYNPLLGYTPLNWVSFGPARNS
jgi:peptide/nickel transport system substrate-binding protein